MLNNNCAACSSQENLRRHHLVPRVMDGHKGPIITLCDDCHRAAHGMRHSMHLGDLVKLGRKKEKKPTGKIPQLVKRREDLCLEYGLNEQICELEMVLEYLQFEYKRRYGGNAQAPR